MQGSLTSIHSSFQAIFILIGLGHAFIDKNLFTTYSFHPPPHLTENLEEDEDPVIQFGINLTALLECCRYLVEGILVVVVGNGEAVEAELGEEAERVSRREPPE